MNNSLAARRKIPQYKFVREVVSFDNAEREATIRQRNVIMEECRVEFLWSWLPSLSNVLLKVCAMLEGNKIDRVSKSDGIINHNITKSSKKGGDDFVLVKKD